MYLGEVYINKFIRAEKYSMEKNIICKSFGFIAFEGDFMQLYAIIRQEQNFKYFIQMFKFQLVSIAGNPFCTCFTQKRQLSVRLLNCLLICSN